MKIREKRKIETRIHNGLHWTEFVNFIFLDTDIYILVGLHVLMYVCECMYGCMYLCMYACLYECMWVCMDASIFIFLSLLVFYLWAHHNIIYIFVSILVESIHTYIFHSDIGILDERSLKVRPPFRRNADHLDSHSCLLTMLINDVSCS